MPQVLSKSQIKDQLAHFPGWGHDANALNRSFEFDEYREGLEFLNKVAELAEKVNHHPDMTLGWCRVEVRITTHSHGGVTELDFELARGIDQVAD